MEWFLNFYDATQEGKVGDGPHRGGPHQEKEVRHSVVSVSSTVGA
jgi:hypothetical protein